MSSNFQFFRALLFRARPEKTFQAVLSTARESQGEERNRDAQLSDAEREKHARLRTELAMLYFRRADAADGDA